MEKPQLFICHSSKDKERFVEGLATDLRQNGVEPWYDDWELKLGDSLTNRILGDLSEDGAIAESDYFLVVVSEHSLESDWVQEELGRGLVGKIAGDTQVLPLILDLEPDEVPPVLDDTLWHRVEDPAEPDEAVNIVLAAIFDKSVKPEPGDPPAYAQYSGLAIPGLQKVDSRVFIAIYDDFYELCGERQSRPGVARFDSEVAPRLFDEGLSEEQIADSVEILDGKRLLKKSSVFGSTRLDRIGAIQPTYLGLKRYLNAREYDLDSTRRHVAAKIANHEIPKTQRVLEQCNQINPLVLYFILEEFNRKGLINLNWTMGSFSGSILSNPQLRRFIQQQE